MRPTLRITLSDGTSKDVQVSAPDIIAFERKFEISLDKLESYEHLCFLAWRVSVRTQATTADFDTWLNGVEFVEFIEGPKGS
jgi:meiotically up-regulated gene 157 (Mug157) protein